MRRKKHGKKNSRPHDAVHRRIFTHARVIQEILERFIKGLPITQFDFSTLELVPSHYVSKFLPQRESDIIWKVRYGQGEDDWFYVYVLMELQSTVERFMALRLWVYIALLYQHLVKQKELPKHKGARWLPPVLPIVLYNGEAPWSAPLSMSELILPVRGLRRPGFEYIVLDASHHPADELKPVKTVVGGVFLMEQAESLQELEALLGELEALFDDRELEEDIALLIGSVAGQLAREAGEQIPSLRTFEEVKNMLLERAEKWPQQWREEGRQRGRQEGLRLGKVEVLKSLASQRFGELPAWAEERFDRAAVDTLDCWSRRLLEAERLEGVFDDE